MPHLGPVDTAEVSGEGAAGEEVVGGGAAAIAALADTAEADTPWFIRPAIPLAMAAPFAAAALAVAAAFAALADAAEADTPSCSMAPIALPIAEPLAAAVDVGTSVEAKVAWEDAASGLDTWDVTLPELEEPAATPADATAIGNEALEGVVGGEDIVAGEEILAVALALPTATEKPDGPGPIPTADERTSPRKAMNAWSAISGEV